MRYAYPKIVIDLEPMYGQKSYAAPVNGLVEDIERPLKEDEAACLPIADGEVVDGIVKWSKT